MNDPKTKQQIVDKIRQSTNILVTVSNSPSVDELSAALGLTLLLNKMDKHSTAIYSGDTPPAITFLEPEATFENTTDSLRDFIIALDKEKADHLRYKLEGDAVKIFITPYRTSITSDDLEFSQGDYNVELVIALGVEDKTHLDAALEAHGRILHDATVVTVSAGEQTSNLGSIDWRDEKASSLGEMLVTLSDAFKDKKLLNKAIATAWLTGIVAATERFSNSFTSSRVMTIAAQLMAAGADQQLIAKKLENGGEISTTKAVGGEEKLEEGDRAKVRQRGDESDDATPPEEGAKSGDGALVISHEKQGSAEEVAEQTRREQSEQSERAAEHLLEKQEEKDQTPQEEQSQTSTEDQENNVQTEAKRTDAAPEPTFSGVLNATTEQAEEEKRRQLEKDKNRKILSHKYISEQPGFDTPASAANEQEKDINAFDAPVGAPSTPATGFDPGTSQGEAKAGPVDWPPKDAAASDAETKPEPSPEPGASPQEQLDAVIEPPKADGPTLADIDAQNRGHVHDEARAAVDAALSAGPQPDEPATLQQEPVPQPEEQQLPPAPEAPFQPPPAPMGAGAVPFTPSPPPPPPQPNDNGLPLPPPLPDFSSLPPAPVAPPDATQPGRLGDILSDQPSQNPGAPVPPPPAENQGPAPAQAPQPNDPGQFRIPGQN